jgi:tetratricopeptide (TPR) repeat protein
MTVSSLSPTKTGLARAGFVALALSSAGALAATTPAAASGGSGGTETKTPTCEPGFVYDPAKKTCVKISSSLDDGLLYEQGRALALAGHYEAALAALTAVKDRNDSMVLTMIGYATRKSGKFDEGMAYYRQALAVNPDNVDTHEYIGEAYAEKGQMDLAKAELVKVEALCGTECEQYEDLAAAIAGTPTE